MLPALLWRCPICKTNDALVHRRRFLRPDRVHCRACGSAWELRRVVGGVDYDLRAIAGPLAGQDRPLAEWYDQMRAGLELTPLPNPSVALEPGEALYLEGRADGLSVLRQDPRFRQIIAALPAPDAPPSPMVQLGQARLFLTDRRLIVGLEELLCSLPLETIRSVTLLIDRFVIIRHERRLIEFFEFAQESPLKWRAYLELALRPVAAAHGHKVHMAYD